MKLPEKVLAAIHDKPLHWWPDLEEIAALAIAEALQSETAPCQHKRQGWSANHLYGSCKDCGVELGEPRPGDKPSDSAVQRVKEAQQVFVPNGAWVRYHIAYEHAEELDRLRSAPYSWARDDASSEIAPPSVREAALEELITAARRVVSYVSWSEKRSDLAEAIGRAEAATKNAAPQEKQPSSTETSAPAGNGV